MNITSIAYTTDGQTLVTSTMGEPLKVWDVKKLVSQPKIPSDSAQIIATAISPDGCYAVTSSTHGHGQVLNPKSGEVYHRFQCMPYVASQLSVTSDSQTALACVKDRFYVWTIKTGEVCHTLESSAPITAFLVMPSGHEIYCVNNAGILQHWSLESGQLLKEWHGMPTEKIKISYLFERQQLLITTEADPLENLYNHPRDIN
ncbi:MAG: hypothetical protein HC799_19920, partial [Limnothrix sp. RL_2_0]|nr:hypothetical protein [Limnothrix sp. RL_2_0]